jgi:hypothetical protein
MRSQALSVIIVHEYSGIIELDSRESFMGQREFEIKYVAMLLGLLFGGGVGLALFLNSGETRLLAWAGVGAALGLILGTRFDQVRQMK